MSNEMEQIGALYAAMTEEIAALQALKTDILAITDKAIGDVASKAIAERLKNADLDTLTSKLYRSTTAVENVAQNANQTALAMQKALGDFKKSTEFTYQGFIKPFLAIFLPMFAAVVLGIFLCLWLLPSGSDVEERRTAIAKLDALGGKAKLSKCDGKPCIRVDTKKTYGENADYFVIK